MNAVNIHLNTNPAHTDSSHIFFSNLQQQWRKGGRGAAFYCPASSLFFILWLLRHITAFSVPKLPSVSPNRFFTTRPFRPDSPLCLSFLTLCSRPTSVNAFPRTTVLETCIPPFLGHFILPSTSIASSLITQPESPPNLFSFILSPFCLFSPSKLYFRSISGQKKSSPLE